MESIVSFVTENLNGRLSSEAIIFIISLMPILELRGGLIAASLLDVPYFRAITICIIGNLLPIPFVLLLIRRIVEFLERFAPTKRIASWIRKRVEKNRGKIEKYGFLGLTLFVGIPLPGTGAWTGSMVAGLLHMNPRRSFPSILLGVLLATVIMSVISYGLIGTLLGNT